MSSQSCTDIEENPDTTLPDPSPSLTDVELSRRSFVKAAGVLTAAAATGIPHLATAEDTQAAAATTPHTATLTLKVNGTPHTLTLDTRTSLLDALHAGACGSLVDYPGARNSRRGTCATEVTRADREKRRGPE